MPEPVFEIVDLNTLTPRKGNPNEFTEDLTKSLDYSIDKYGFLQPLVVNQDGIIVDGFHRYDVLKEKGIEQVRVSRVFTKNEEELKLLSQALNKIRGQHDLKKDITEMEHLLGYDPNELKILLGFDEEALDVLRQRAAEEEMQLLNLMKENDNNQSQTKSNNNNQQQEELDEIITNNKCPKCSYEW